ncbi:tyrosine-protein phosphatase [Qipengyuania sp. DSG2-2]|uniref:tyrosine-protein phosphatase n=1 Tax=Qipengyuania sp. DGS2-2 TaxID=3349631 RepID=UPI0036D35E54
MIREPFLPMQGIHNFRDYGGYETRDGGRVRTGLLFRSGQHVEAEDADLEALDALDIRTVIDLRGQSERERNPCRRSDGFDAQVLMHPGETTSSPPHEDVGDTMPTGEYARQRMIAVYTRMPVNDAMISMFGRYFKALDERDGGSLVHCFAGKDRTGIAASMLLHVLDVPFEMIEREFLLTNHAPSVEVLKRQSLPGIEARLGKLDEESVRNLMGVRSEYLSTYLDAVTASHGSFDAYLEQEIGVDDAMRARLKARFVE